MTTTTTTEKPMKMKRVFKSTFQSHIYLFGSHKDSTSINGKPAHFINFEYITDNPQEIIELEEQITVGHPHIYIDENRKEIAVNPEDPINVIRRKAVEDYLKAQMADAVNPSNDRGETDQTAKLVGIGNTASVAPAAAGSVSGAPNMAALANLKK